MGRRGPHKQPTAIKLVRGTHRPDRDGDASSEPQPPPASLAVPKDLGSFGALAWTEKAPLLLGLGLFTESDRGAFHTYCRAHDEIAKCDELLAEQGEDFTTEKGFVCQHPAVSRRFKWFEVKRRYEIEFGMTPSSRSGLKVDKPNAAGVMTRKRA